MKKTSRLYYLCGGCFDFDEYESYHDLTVGMELRHKGKDYLIKRIVVEVVVNKSGYRNGIHSVYLEEVRREKSYIPLYKL